MRMNPKKPTLDDLKNKHNRDALVAELRNTDLIILPDF